FCSAQQDRKTRNTPKKLTQESKDRTARLTEDRILAKNLTMNAAYQAVTPKLGLSWRTARQ
ncbi:hypothetical protein, partial [Rothia nasimurium]|uniref:hypothetical protein n=1 Tax=Rothia nasimurium TaxID=85336 RepID=UPI00117A9255